jgi:hypothetical protein
MSVGNQSQRHGALHCVRSLEGLQRVPGRELQPDHAHLGAAGGSYRLDQLPIAAAETPTPVGAAQPVTKIDPLARTRPHVVTPVQVSCAAW